MLDAQRNDAHTTHRYGMALTPPAVRIVHRTSQDGKNPEDYHLYFDAWWQRDLDTMVLRDRNSPSVLLWSIGNEIGMRTRPAGWARSKQLAERVRALDPGATGSARAVTSAVPGAVQDAFYAPLDVAGYNYARQLYDTDHERVPKRVMVATETFPSKAIDDWRAAMARPYMIGNFIWTAIDYIGESAIGANGHYEPSPLACGAYCAQPYPYHISFCGDLDLVGDDKPQAKLRKVLWNVSALELSVQRPGVEVIGAWGYRDEQQTWTWPGMPPEAADMSVRAYASSGCVAPPPATTYTQHVHPHTYTHTRTPSGTPLPPSCLSFASVLPPRVRPCSLSLPLAQLCRSLPQRSRGARRRGRHGRAHRRRRRPIRSQLLAPLPPAPPPAAAAQGARRGHWTVWVRPHLTCHHLPPTFPPPTFLPPTFLPPAFPPPTFFVPPALVRYATGASTCRMQPTLPPRGACHMRRGS